MPVSGQVAIVAPPHSTRTTITPGPPLRAQAGAGRRKYPSLAAGIHPKLLNMRDFPTFEGFPPPPKTRYNSFLANRPRASVWPISTGMAFHAKSRHWLGQVSCLHAADPFHDVISAVPGTERSTAGPVTGADQKAKATWIFTPSSSC